MGRSCIFNGQTCSHLPLALQRSSHIRILEPLVLSPIASICLSTHPAFIHTPISFSALFSNLKTENFLAISIILLSRLLTLLLWVMWKREKCDKMVTGANGAAGVAACSTKESADYWYSQSTLHLIFILTSLSLLIPFLFFSICSMNAEEQLSLNRHHQLSGNKMARIDFVSVCSDLINLFFCVNLPY